MPILAEYLQVPWLLGKLEYDTLYSEYPLKDKQKITIQNNHSRLLITSPIGQINT